MSEPKKISCPICKLEDTTIESSDDFGRMNTYNCRRCGRYIISNLALSTAELGPELSAWVRDRNENSDDIPKITSDTVKYLPNYSPSDKQLILLRNIEHKSEYPGHEVKLVPVFDIPLAWASNMEEFIYYLQSLQDRDLLKFQEELLKIRFHRLSPISNFVLPVAISPKGWDFLEERTLSFEDKTQVFVAMSFSDDMKPVWDKALKDAITRAGYKPYRIDVEPHIDRIDAKIITEIKNSRFIVADVTEHKHGVYFEAGYALGLGLPVIWCVRKDHLSKVHFDTRQYNHIVWESEDKLNEQLYNVICAVIGKGH